MLVDGRPVITDSWIEVKDPGQLTDIVGRVATGSKHHVGDAVEAAQRALDGWKRVPLKERCALLEQAATHLAAMARDMVTVQSRESGVITNTIQAEFNQAVQVLRSTAQYARESLAPVWFQDGNNRVRLEMRPFGVIAGIVPWNAPIMLTMKKVAPALACGNTVIIKPSPNAPIAVSLVLQQFAELLPPGVIGTVHGGTDVGEALVSHPKVRKISFTGGGTVASQIMRDAADGLKGVHFELGGNDPAIVLLDAKFGDVVPKIATAAFRRSGQVCFAVKRVYVPQLRYEEFCGNLTEYIEKFVVGHQLSDESTFGPMNNRTQYQFVQSLLDQTANTGADVQVLGRRGSDTDWDNGYYMLPTLVTRVEPSAQVVVSEQFGPILPIVPYQSEAEVIQFANATEYGLGSSIWSADVEHALRIASEIEAGMTYINAHGLSPLGRMQIPWGGVKHSGIGREDTKVGLAEYFEYHGTDLPLF